MTDYRDFNQPGVHAAHRDAYSSSQPGTSVGGVLIALVLIGLVILGFSIFFSGSAGDGVNVPVVDQSTSESAVPAPATDPTLAPAPATPSE